MIFAKLLMILGLCSAVIGGGYYMLEYLRGNVTMSTKWNELNTFQRECFVLAVVGLAIFFGALIAAVILRS